jgi:DNA polymerase-3 subunit delta'
MQWNIYGHEWATEILQKHIQQDHVRHAYLFTGPPGIGRRTLAVRFAQAINCTQPPEPGLPCGTCRICKHIEKMQQADLTITQKLEDASLIKVEQIRELQRSLSLAPYEARYRIAMLLNFQDAKDSPQNALLKTLEEAPAKVILLLTADSAENLLPTIVSRCEILRLRPMPVEQLSATLQEKWQVEPENAAILSHLSGGRLGLAYRYHQQPEQLEQIHAWLQDAFDLLSYGRVERFTYAEQHTDPKKKGVSRDSIRLMLQTWLVLWRDLFLAASGSGMPLTYTEFQPNTRSFARQIDLPTARRLVSRMEEALTQLDANLNPRLLVENLLLDWPVLEVVI